MPRPPDAGTTEGRGSKPRSLSVAAPNPRLMAWSLALLRVFVGIKFVLAGAPKWNWIGTPTLQKLLAGWVNTTSPEWYAHFLQQRIIPQAPLFTYLVVFGEVGIGLLLTFGLLTRVAALLALVMSVNYLLATWALGAASQGLNESFIAMEMSFLLTGAGRIYGLDAHFARKYPRSPFW